MNRTAKHKQTDGNETEILIYGALDAISSLVAIYSALTSWHCYIV